MRTVNAAGILLAVAADAVVIRRTLVCNVMRISDWVMNLVGSKHHDAESLALSISSVEDCWARSMRGNDVACYLNAWNWA